MQISDLTVEVRDSTLARVGQITPADLVGATFVLRFNAVGSWNLTLRGDSPMATLLRAAGAGLIVTGPSGTIFSGPTTSATLKQTTEDPIGVWSIGGVDDSAILYDRLAYPNPSVSDVTLQTSEYDIRSGVCSTVLYGYVNDNIGTTASTARKISTLTMAADTAIGSTVSYSARFDTLQTVCYKLAWTAGLGFNVKQIGSGLVFTVFDPADLTASVRLDINNNRLESSDYGYTAPEITRAIVAGSGSGTSRTFVEVTTASSTAAESVWVRRIERFVDNRSTSDTTELTVAGEAELADKGMTITGLSVQPTDMDTMRYQIDWNLGDTVSVVVGSDTIQQVVQEVGIGIAEDGVRIIATVGFPKGVTE